MVAFGASVSHHQNNIKFILQHSRNNERETFVLNWATMYFATDAYQDFMITVLL